MKKLIAILFVGFFSIFAQAAELAINDDLTVVVTATSVDAEVKAAAEDYYERLRANVKKYQYYPSTAVRLNFEGQIMMKVTVDNGKAKVELLDDESSPHYMLQTAALKIMDRAIWATAVPELLKTEFISVRAPIVFKLLGA